jgi:hypothetical protein
VLKRILAALAAVTLIPLSACDIEAVVAGDCCKAIGVAFLDQPIRVRDRMQAIAWRESRWRPTATNGQHYGCLQIATREHAARIARLGFSAGDMLRPWPNAKVARSLYDDSGLTPWAATA